MKKFLFVFIFILGTMTVKAQEAISVKRNSFYAEFGGASFLSVNYEKLFPLKTSFTISGRIGFGINALDIYKYGPYPGSDVIVTAPITISYIYGHKHSFENGIGFTFGSANSEGLHGINGRGNIKWFNGFIGYRYQKPDGKFLFRLGYTPQIGHYQDTWNNDIQALQVLHWFGMSLGSRF